MLRVCYIIGVRICRPADDSCLKERKPANGKLNTLLKVTKGA